MQLFIVVFEDDMPAATLEQARRQFEAHKMSDRALLIRTQIDDPVAISSFLGIDEKSSSPVVGMVLKLNGSRSGYYYKSTWDWFREWSPVSV